MIPPADAASPTVTPLATPTRFGRKRWPRLTMMLNGMYSAMPAGMSSRKAAGYDATLADHRREVAAFWASSDVSWTGSQAAQQALRFGLFSMLQGSARSEGHGVPAKGLTGTGYEGHYFWDTETYLLPFLIHSRPEVARSLLMHRIEALPAARLRAREVSCDGALFPWRTINGSEQPVYYCSSLF